MKLELRKRDPRAAESALGLLAGAQTDGAYLGPDPKVLKDDLTDRFQRSELLLTFREMMLEAAAGPRQARDEALEVLDAIDNLITVLRGYGVTFVPAGEVIGR